MIKVLKSKIHRACVTDVNIQYEGSITIDKELLDIAGIKTYEFVDVWNVTNGERFETYVIEGEKGSRKICINGAAARMAAPSDLVIIASHRYIPEDISDSHEPVIVIVDESNNPK